MISFVLALLQFLIILLHVLDPITFFLDFLVQSLEAVHIVQSPIACLVQNERSPFNLVLDFGLITATSPKYIWAPFGILDVAAGLPESMAMVSCILISLLVAKVLVLAGPLSDEFLVLLFQTVQLLDLFSGTGVVFQFR